MAAATVAKPAAPPRNEFDSSQVPTATAAGKVIPVPIMLRRLVRQRNPRTVPTADDQTASFRFARWKVTADDASGPPPASVCRSSGPVSG